MTYDIELLYERGQINEYFYVQLKKNLHYLPADLQEQYIEEAIAMSNVGVSTSQDQREFFYVLMHTPEILEKILEVKNINYNILSKISAEVFANRSRYPIDTLLNFFYAVANAAVSLGLPVKLPPHIKLAYPQSWHNFEIKQPYDVNRWMRATRDIYLKANQGQDFSQAMDEVLGNWDKMEKMDYKHWLRFYQEGAQMKYKMAQYYVADAGVYIPNPLDRSDLKSTLPNPLRLEESPFKDRQKAEDKNDARDRIEQQRFRIISRLNAAEKLLSSMDGQFFAGDEQEYMLKLLQDLKRKVQTANKIRIKSSLFEDFIWRTGNQLKKQGKNNQAAFFYKVAQDPAADPAGVLLGKEKPTEAVDELPKELPADEELPSADLLPEYNGLEEQTREVLKEFFDRLRDGVRHFDEVEDDDDGLHRTSEASEDAFIIVKAQETMPQEAAPQQRPRQEQPRDAEVLIEAALDSVTIEDVIRRLEVLSGLFKRREIARQLSIVDLMMDKLGIGAFFPNLGEATRSALESNQYVATRIEEILNKLRASVEGRNAAKLLEVSEDEAPPSPEVQTAIENIQQQQQKEDERKERRKMREEIREQAPTPTQEAVRTAPTTVEPSPEPAIPR